MTNNDQRLAVFQQALYSHKDCKVYAVLDGASVPNLQQLFIDHKVEHVCLYRGELEPDMAEVAPYLAHLPADSAFTRQFLEEGWNHHWGVLALSKSDLRVLRTHFRKFLMVYDPDGKPLYFRYYDPRVLRIYLPTCNAEELKTVFGPVEAFVLEGETPKVSLRFTYGTEGLGKYEMALPALNTA